MITIVKNSDNTFSVLDGDWVANDLGWDEMLGCIARITMHDGISERPYMRNYTEEYFKKIKQQISEE